MQSDEIVLQYVRRGSVIELQDANRPSFSNNFLVLYRADGQVFNVLELEEVVNFAVVGVLARQEIANESLLCEAQYLMPRRGRVCE